MASIVRVFGIWTVLFVVFMFIFYIVGAIAAGAGGRASLIIYLVMTTSFWIFFIAIFWRHVYGPMYTTHRILETGEDGTAKIITLTETGSSLQSGGAIAKPGVRLALKVKPANGKPEYEATVNTFLSMFELSQYRPGREVKVRIDRKNPEKVAIVGQVGPLQTYASTIRSEK